MTELSISLNNLWIVVSIFLAIAFFLFIAFYYRRTNPPLKKSIRIFLALCRSVAIALLLIVLAEPVLSYVVIRQIDPHVAVLFDDSESIRSVENFELKREAMDVLLSGGLPTAGDEKTITDFFAFSDSLRPFSDSLAFNGKRTALGDCINELADEYREVNLRGVVVISDGLLNSGTNPLSAAAELAVPFYTVDAGPQRSSRDIRIVKVIHDDIAYKDRPSTLELEVESRGFEGVTLPIRVRSEGKTVASGEIKLSGEASRQRTSIEFVPPSTGVKTFSVSLPSQPEEELVDNNKRSFSMKVLKSRVKILLAAGYLNWELTFLKRILDNSDDFDYDLTVFDRSNRLNSAAFPSTAEALGEYDLVILLDYSPSILASKLAALNSYLKDHGKPVLFILGEEFTKAFPSKDLRELLPFDGNAKPLFRHDDFHIRLTEQGRHHPAMQVGSSTLDVQESWNDLPPFEAYVVAGKEKDDATVLAVHPEPTREGKLLPLLLAHRVGSGKVLTIGAGPLWKTDFLSRGRGGTGEEYSRFIHSCIRWLITSEDLERIRISPDKVVFRSGEKVSFTASLLDDSYQPIDEGSVVLSVYPDSGLTRDTLVASMVRTAPGKMTANLHLLEAGDYGYSADFTVGDSVSQVTGSFMVEPFSLEEEAFYEKEDLLRELAVASGGNYASLLSMDSLFANAELSSSEKRNLKEHPLTHYWLILLIVLALLSVEWAVRKRLQLM